MKGHVEDINMKRHMIELNIETSETICKGLNLLKNFSSIDNNAKINSSLISVKPYNNVNQWLFNLMSMLFISSSIKLEQVLIEDIEEVIELFTETEYLYDYYFEGFLESYEYCNIDEEIEESEQYKYDFNEYFSSLNTSILRIYSPFVEQIYKHCDSFIEYVPYLIGNYYEIAQKELICCRMEQSEKYPDKDHIAIYYLDGIYNLYADTNTYNAYNEFEKAIEIHKELNGGGK